MLTSQGRKDLEQAERRWERVTAAIASVLQVTDNVQEFRRVPNLSLEKVALTPARDG